MIRFCQSVHAYLLEDPDNVVAVHCKGGKGRTGTLICTWLVECGKFEEAEVRRLIMKKKMFRFCLTVTSGSET